MGVKVREKVKGSGDWWIIVHHNGKRRSKFVGKGAKARKTAEEVAKKIEAKLVLGEFHLEEEPVPTFGEYAKTWQENHLPAICKASTVRDYGGLLGNHVLPVFKNRPVDEITRGDVKNFLLKKASEGYASSTVTHMKNVISAVLGLAVDEEKIAQNPSHRLGKISKPRPMAPAQFALTKGQLAKLLATFREHFPEHYPLALLLARTGLRRGEALGLQWGDVNLQDGYLMVRRTISRSEVETPKNHKSRRVHLTPQLAEELQQLADRREAEAKEKDRESLPAWVFVNRDGGPLDGQNWLKRVFQPALEKAKVPKIRIHDLRHTYATHLLHAGVPVHFVKDQLGHHSIKVTVDIYGHLLPGTYENLVGVLDQEEEGEEETHPDAPYTHPDKTKGLRETRNPLFLNGGSDETRTRDLRRDRPAF